jgi:DNA-binding Lrp family transcriptional regulator
MDEMDQKLLGILQKEGRISFRELAQQLDVSSQTISDRITKLKEKGVIKQFAVIVDQPKIGYPITFVVELDVELQNMEKIQNHLAEYPELYEVHVVTGEHDILALGMARDIMHMYDIIEEKISKIKGVKATKTSISLKRVKDTPKGVF